MIQNTNYFNAPIHGFASVLKQRRGMQQWSTLSRLNAMGANREAESIVASFQQQIDREQAESAQNTIQAA